MRSEEARIAEAITALTARLDAWQVDDAATKASEYVRDMVRNGWRPRALPVAQPDPPGMRPVPPPPEFTQARLALVQPVKTHAKPVDSTEGNTDA